MPQSSEDLELFRERFLDQLHSSRIDLQGHEQYLAFWQTVEKEAEVTEDLDRLDNWVREMARDRDRVRALEARVEQQDHDTGALDVLLQLLRFLLDALEGIETKLLRLRNDRYRKVGAILWRVAVGAKAVPKPDDKDETEETKGSGRDEKKDQVARDNLLRNRQKAAKPAPPPEKEKKKEA